jgi:cyclohexanecarboxyl-CoA dehydrogenase
MLGFSFSEEQEMLRTMVRDFARRELAPTVKERAKLDAVPRELILKVGELGLLGLNLPSEYGGTEADWVSCGIVAEELAKVDSAVCALPHQVIGCGLTLMQGNPNIIRDWLPRLIRGEIMIAQCITEPGCGSDAAAMQCRAVKEGDKYRIRGEKTAITTFGLQVDAALVFAKTDPTQGARGITAFLVPLDSPGIERSLLKHTGLKPFGAASIIFDNTPVPEEYRLGEEGEGFRFMLKGLDFIRASVGLEALGAAQAALEETISFTRERHAFGRPIAKFEGVSFKIAEGATLIDAARLLCYRALWLKDQGLPNVKEIAMCKWFATKVAFDVVHDALLTHGHVGYSEEFPMEQRLRDVLGLQITDGTTEIQKMVIARELIGDEALPYR